MLQEATSSLCHSPMSKTQHSTYDQEADNSHLSPFLGNKEACASENHGPAVGALPEAPT